MDKGMEGGTTGPSGRVDSAPRGASEGRVNLGLVSGAGEWLAWASSAPAGGCVPPPTELGGRAAGAFGVPVGTEISSLAAGASETLDSNSSALQASEMPTSYSCCQDTARLRGREGTYDAFPGGHGALLKPVPQGNAVWVAVRLALAVHAAEDAVDARCSIDRIGARDNRAKRQTASRYCRERATHDCR
ncbi:hypothetical protein APUTEX25_003979 [Auxenochlorella protothecoides]|uniref:Uncharacterized protein n=1 Tax=Auxenochlorella protothecoides TaxID=3075 RepID=A0A3M7KVP6_AUXPR|nr:hypothetical protein APUTEX25_003979 [Auxenochlorella protothecoides]|eukprot:RMZ53840.1 hypothetical protein APUTEX25_003979 [Auxenochlorella protothecoides]